MKRQYTPDDIEDYIHGRMDPTSRKALEMQMDTDPELVAEVSFFQQLTKKVASQTERDFAKVVSKVDADLHETDFFSQKEQEAKQKQSPLLAKRRNRWAIAASFLLLVFAGATWFANNQFTDSTLAWRNFPYDWGTSTRTEINTNNPISLALEAFAEQRWAESIQLLESISPDNEQYIEARYTLGQVFFHQKNYAKAIRNFETVRNSGDKRFVENADWKLLLSLLAARERVRFEELLNQLINTSDHPYHNKAMDLQKKRNSFWRILVF